MFGKVLKTPLKRINKTKTQHSNNFFKESNESIRLISIFRPFKCQPHKMVNHTQAIRRQIASVCLTILWGWRLKGQFVLVPLSLMLSGRYCLYGM